MNKLRGHSLLATQYVHMHETWGEKEANTREAKS